MTAATTWWQTLSARKDRLAELDLRLRHERLLRDEDASQSAMQELVYAFRKFSNSAIEAHRHHRHNMTMLSQAQESSVANLIEVGQVSIDLLDKHASLIDGGTRNALEFARDR